MTSSSMPRSLILAGGILAFCLIGFLCVRHSLESIPQGIAQSAAKELTDADMQWARVRVEGRHLFLTGLAPDDQARLDAGIVVTAVDGVRAVDNRLITIEERFAGQTERPLAVDKVARVTGATPSQAAAVDELFADLSYEMRIQRDGDNIALTGTMPSNAMIKTVTQLAAQRFGATNVRANLVARGDAPLNWLQAAGASLALLEYVQHGEIAIVDDQVTLTGQAVSADAASKLQTRVGNSLPPGYQGVSRVSAGTDVSDLMRTNPGLAERIGDAGGLPASTLSNAADNASASQQTAALPPPVAATVPAAQALAELTAAQCQQRINQTVATQTIRFETASDVIDESSLALLDQLAEIAARCPRVRIEIGGHTDDQGTQSNNLALSQRRAESVMAYLVSRGLRLGRLTARGYGEDEPLVPNVNLEARARNRRIEFNIAGGN